ALGDGVAGLLRLAPGCRQRADPQSVPAGSVAAVTASARASQSDGWVGARTGWALSAEGSASGSPRESRSPVPAGGRGAGVQSGAGVGRVLDFDRGASVGVAGAAVLRCRPGTATDHCGAQGNSRNPAGAGVGGCVRLAAALSGTTARPDPPGPNPAGVV